MTSSDDEERYDGLSPKPLIHNVKSGNHLCKRFFKGLSCTKGNFSDISEEQKDSNVIKTFQEQTHDSDRNASESCLDKRLFKRVNETVFDTSQKQEDSNEFNAFTDQAQNAVIRASKNYLGKWFFQNPYCIRKDCFDTSEEQSESNKIAAPAEHIFYAPREAARTPVGKRLFSAPSYVREECSDTSLEEKKSNEVCAFAGQDHHTARKGPKDCFGVRLFQSLHCVRDDISKNSEEQKKFEKIHAASEQIHLVDRTPEASLNERLFYSPQCASGDFLNTCEELRFSNEIDKSDVQINRATARTPEICLDNSLFPAPLYSAISEDENDSKEIDIAALKVYLETRQDLIKVLSKRLLQEQNSLRKSLVSEISKQQNDINEMGAVSEQIHQAALSDREVSMNAEEEAKESWGGAWKACHFWNLPQWLQDNDFLLSGHRPPLESFGACFLSVFRIHTETVNIWTHLVGCALFIGITAHFLSNEHMTWRDKLVFGAFLVSVILCLGTSSVFHAVSCHSEPVSKLFGKLDYCGIAALIIGSFVPWLHYGFYCERRLRVFYCTLVTTLGTVSASLSLSDRFSEPCFRHIRAALFAGFGLSGVVPATHYLVSKGWVESLGWLVLMATLYLLGAAIYASRIPERFFPGRCDILFQSHQIFHVLVVAAALVHYHGTRDLASRVLMYQECV